MVKIYNLKSLSIRKFLILIFVSLCINNFVFAQETKINDENNTNITSSSFDENSTSYFSDSSSNQINEASSRSRNRTSIWMFIRMILVLVFICVLIYLFLFFLKRKTNIPSSDNEYLRRAAYISIGQNKTVEVITLIDKAYLIGTTEDNITLLGEIDDKELIQAMNLSADKKQNVKNPVNFSEVLDMFTKKSTKSTKSIFEESERNIDEIINEETSTAGNAENGE